jgi:diguanylate cyclase (GGDEF)-like protein
MEKIKNILTNKYVLILLFTPLFVPLFLPQEKSVYFIIALYIIKIIYLFICFVVLVRLKFKQITIGTSLLLIGWVWELIDEFDLLFQRNEYLSFFIYETLTFAGIILIIYGILGYASANKSLIDRLSKQVYYDTLTRLPNRNMLIYDCPRKKYGKCNSLSCICKDREDIIKLEDNSALLFLDVDNFKHINDNIGHHFGDVLLKKLARNILSAVDKTDTVARLYGDEFVVILNPEHYKEGLENVIKKIQDSVNQAYVLKGNTVRVTSSIGVAIYPQHGNDIATLLKNADIAMYDAKQNGKNQFCIYDEIIYKSSQTKFVMANDLRNAIANDSFILYFQPKASVATNEVTGLEALIRWNHPSKGMVSPDYFIPLAEELNIIKSVDVLVLHKICKLLKSWEEEGRKMYNISINISPQFFNTVNFIDTFFEVIDEYNIDTRYLSIELTENSALNESPSSLSKIMELRQRNIKVYLDDYGKGYSSYNYIKQFTFDYIKIDKSYIDHILHNKSDQVMFETVVKLSEFNGYKVVAEGVEDGEQLEFLKKMGCHEYQGYYFSKPKPIEELNL